MKKENLNKEEYRELLEDLCCEYCEPKRYCILKEFLVSLHPSPRVLVQLKLIDKFKWTLSEKAKKDVGWTEAIAQWIEGGCAKKFAECYDEEDNVSISSLYKKVTKSERTK